MSEEVGPERAVNQLIVQRIKNAANYLTKGAAIVAFGSLVIDASGQPTYFYFQIPSFISGVILALFGGILITFALAELLLAFNPDTDLKTWNRYMVFEYGVAAILTLSIYQMVLVRFTIN